MYQGSHETAPEGRWAMAEEPPTAWELMRAITSLRDSVNNLAAGMVTQTTMAVYQQAQKDRDDRQDARLKALEQEQDEQRKARSQQWFAITLAIVGGVVSIIVAFVLRGAGVQ